MNGKADTGSVNTETHTTIPGTRGCIEGSPGRPTGGSIPGVSGDSSGKLSGSGSAPSVSGGREGSPNQSGNPQHAVSGPERMPITS